MRITIEPKETYLSVLVTGVWELGDAKTLSRQFLEAAAELRLSKILIDGRPVSGKISTMDKWHYSRFMVDEIQAHRKLSVLPEARLAYVGPEALVDPRRFGETVASNRGISVKVTTDLVEALDYLGVDQAHRPGVGKRG